MTFDNSSNLTKFPHLANITKSWSYCADCSDSNPKWAEITRGILICIACAGVHRNLGSHISKVRSLTLDVWQLKWVQRMQTSDAIFNKEWEYNVPKEYKKPTQYSSRITREKYIRAKYQQSLFRTKKNKSENNNNSSAALLPVYDDAVAGNEINDTSKKGMVKYTGVVNIEVISAKNLPKADLMSNSDPYVVFDSGTQTVRSSVIDNNNNPVWKNERLMLSVNEERPIKISIYDEDKFSSDDFLCWKLFNVGHSECARHLGQEIEFKDFQMTLTEEYSSKSNAKQPLFTFKMSYTKL